MTSTLDNDTPPGAALSESRFREIAREVGKTREGQAFLSALELRARVVAVDEVRSLVTLVQKWQ